jgi:RNA polymerase sigma-70 factor (ECF subfamily)
MIRSAGETVYGLMNDTVTALAPHSDLAQWARPNRVSVPEVDYDRLIEAIALRRDRQAFSVLFAHFAPRLKAYLMKAGATPGAAEEFAQDALLTVWRKADLFDSSKAGAAAWIFTIARNRRLDVLRKDARAPRLQEIDLAPAEPDQPDRILAMGQDADRVRAALACLDAGQVEAIKLAFFEDVAHSEVASRLGLPLGTVKSRIRMALIKLRRQLDPSGEGDLS